jgi:hypothetical protein
MAVWHPSRPVCFFAQAFPFAKISATILVFSRKNAIRSRNMSTSPSPWDVDIDALVADRQAFSEFVYTPLREAMAELKRRREDSELEKKILELLDNDIPEPFQSGPRATLLRYIVTPNYEIRRFFHIGNVLENDIKPLLIEYIEDKFFPSNKLKRLLGKLGFYRGKDSNGGSVIDRMKIIDFDSASGEKLSNVKTIWNQTLVDFHHQFFEETFRKIDKSQFYNISQWYKKHGPTSNHYYKDLMTIFVWGGILFENFVLGEDEELDFIKEVFLPSFINIYRLLELKPLIIALEPTLIEGDKFWLCYPPSSKKFVQQKLTETNLKKILSKLTGVFKISSSTTY